MVSEGRVGFGKLLGVGILCSRRCHEVPVNLQQDKRYFLLCNFSSLYEWRSVTPLKVRTLTEGSPVYFRLWETFLKQKQ